MSFKRKRLDRHSGITSSKLQFSYGTLSYLSIIIYIELQNDKTNQLKKISKNHRKNTLSENNISSFKFFISESLKVK